MYEILIISFYYFLTRFFLFEKIYKFVFSKYDSSVTKTWVRLSYLPLYGEFLAFVAIAGPILTGLVEIMWNLTFVEEE